MRKEIANSMRQHLVLYVVLVASIGWGNKTVQAQTPTLKTLNQMETTTTETDKITISENPQQVYTLERKEGKPFTGYEVTEEKLLGEFPFVNYYEKGELKIKYAVDYLAKDQYEPPIEYTLKTIYSNGEVITGNVYRDTNNGLLLTDHYVDKKRVGVSVDIFAMHYFNRLRFQLEDKQLVIQSFDSKDEVKIYKKDGWAVADYYVEGKRVQQSQPILVQVEAGTPQSNAVFYYGSDNKLRQYNVRINEEYVAPISDNELLNRFYNEFSFAYAGEVEDILDFVDRFFTTATPETEEPLFESLAIPYTKETLLAYVSYDQTGKPEQAMLFDNSTDKKYQQFTPIKKEITDLTTMNQLLEVLKADCNE